MSRIGKLPVNLPAGVTVTVSPDNVVSVKGPLGTLSQKVDSDIKVEVGTHTEVHTGKEVPAVLVSRPTNQPRHRSLHGLYRALINNMVVGVSKGLRNQTGARGRRFQGRSQGQHSRNEPGLLARHVSDAAARSDRHGRYGEERQPDRHTQKHRQALIGQVAAKIRSLRKPEPYKGKGIKFVGEVLRRKAGKSAGAK